MAKGPMIMRMMIRVFQVIIESECSFILSQNEELRKLNLYVS